MGIESMGSSIESSTEELPTVTGLDALQKYLKEHEDEPESPGSLQKTVAVLTRTFTGNGQLSPEQVRVITTAISDQGTSLEVVLSLTASDEETGQGIHDEIKDTLLKIIDENVQERSVAIEFAGLLAKLEANVNRTER